MAYEVDEEQKANNKKLIARLKRVIEHVEAGNVGVFYMRCNEGTVRDTDTEEEFDAYDIQIRIGGEFLPKVDDDDE